MSGFKESVGRRAPRWAVRSYRKARTLWEFFQDYRLYAASTDWHLGSGGKGFSTDAAEALLSRLVLASHGLEKGGTMPTPRRPYGLARRDEITALLGSRLGQETLPEWAVTAAREALSEHAVFNETGDISDVLSPRGNSLVRRPLGSVETFVTGRRSIRNFQLAEVPPHGLLSEAVRLAATSPSVCNRRAYRAYLFEDPETIQRILRLQNGNGGFSESIPALFVVCERRSAFVGAGERNQRWVDGGLFAMSLVWVLYALGVGTCFLNWSQTNDQTQALRRVAGIPVTEDVVVLIAAGYPDENHRVARSPERPLGDVFWSDRLTESDIVGDD